MENGKACYITLAGKIGRSIFVYNPATKAWNYFDKEGTCVPGYQYIDGYLYYFKEDGSQSKGESIEENTPLDVQFGPDDLLRSSTYIMAVINNQYLDTLTELSE